MELCVLELRNSQVVIVKNGVLPDSAGLTLTEEIRLCAMAGTRLSLAARSLMATARVTSTATR